MKPVVSPPRLIDAKGSLGDLMREAKQEYETSLEGASAWRRYQDRPQRSPWHRLLVPSLAVAAAVGFLALYGHSEQRSPDLLAQAEPTTPRPSHPASAVSPALETSPPKAAQAREPLLNPRPLRSSVSGDAHRALPALVNGAPAPAASAMPLPEPAVDCLSYARSGNTQEAERCFEGQTSNQDLSAEVALYELSRLRRDALGSPAAALTALDEYLRRFPKGNLSGEVRFSRLELLVKLGRNTEVMRASDELLASPSGAERAPEIHLLRGNVAAHALKDSAGAAREYALAKAAPGRVGDEGAFLEAVSLEKLGDVAHATQAFQAYLGRTGARHVDEARTHLSALAAKQ